MEGRYETDLADADLSRGAQDATEIVDVLRDVDADGADALLAAALEHRLDVCWGRMLELLRAVGYDPELLARAAEPMRIGAEDWRERALALLEPALSPAHRELLSPLGAAPDARAQASDPGSRHERLLEIALGRYAWASHWVRACALRALDPQSPADWKVLELAASEPDGLLADAAAEAVAGASGAPRGGPEERIRRLPVRVEILKAVSLFRPIPHEDLLGVASLLGDRRACPGEDIVRKGDVGDSLYVIAAGSVRVHDGERTLAHLGERDYFGVLSLLDHAPQGATMTALSDTHLLRLGQADFYAVIAERPHILRGVNRQLCQIVRRSLAATESSDGAVDPVGAEVPPAPERVR
jgi:hypothetical protein